MVEGMLPAGSSCGKPKAVQYLRAG